MKTAIVALPIVASVLIVGLAVTLLWMIGSVSGERERFSSLEIAPKDGDVFVAVNTDPTSPQWLAVNDSLDAINAKDPIRRAIDEALAEVNLDWEEDILPVAGDEAFFSVPDVSEAGTDGGYVAGFRLRDTEKAREVFDGLRERAVEEGQEYREEEYEGVTIYYTVGPETDFDGLSGLGGGSMFCMTGPDGKQECTCEDERGSYSAQRVGVDGWTCRGSEPDRQETLSPNGAVALFEDVLALGGSPDDVKLVIDVVQGRAPSAQENERLQEFRETQKEDFLMWGYVDMAQVWDMAEGFADVTLEQGEDQSGPVEPEPLPTAAPPPSPDVPRDDDFAVRSFDSDIVVDSNGSLLVTEHIVVDFGALPKHGIFRDIPTEVPYNFENNELIEIGQVGVTRDGQPESYEVSRAQPYTEIRIGDPGVTISGTHEYVIQYTVYGGIMVFEPGEDGFYEVSWNVTGDRWSVPIEKASATVTVPSGEVLGASCNVGIDPTDMLNVYLSEGCDEGIPSLQSVTVNTDAPISAGTGLSIRVPVDGPINAQPPVLSQRDTFTYDGFEFPSEEPEEPILPFAFNSEETFDELRGTYDRVGFSISAAGDGFALDLTVLYTPGFEPDYAVEPTEVFDSHFADSVPADTMLFFAGYDLYGQTKAFSDYLDQLELADGSTGDDFLEDFAEATGLDLEEDILALLTGEYAVAGNVSGFDKDTPDFSIMALMDVADAAKAEEALHTLGAFLEDENHVNVDDSGEVQRWSFTGDSGIEAVGVAVEREAVIAGYPDGTVKDAVDGLGQSLADTEDWKRTLQLLPQDTTSVGFVSLARIFEELRGTEAEQSFNDSTGDEFTLDDLAAIRSVGFATTTRDNGFGMHFVLFTEDR